MTILNPLILIALTAVSIPIIIHLFNLRKVKKVEFSTLMFLKELQRSRLRKIKIRRLILLALRILIIVFLVLAFSDPFHRGYTALSGENLPKLGIIILDNSFSMSASNTQGSYLSQSLADIKQITGFYSPDDKLYVVYNKTDSSGSYYHFDEILASRRPLDSLLKIEYSPEKYNIETALIKTANIIKNNAVPIVELYLLSDFQSINFSSLSLSGEEIIPNEPYLYLIDYSTRIPANISVNYAGVRSGLLEPGKELKFRVILKNHNDFPVTNKNVFLEENGTKVSEIVTDLLPFERKETEISWYPQKKGKIELTAELSQSDFSEDELKEDNSYRFNFIIPEQFSTGLYSGNEEDTRYIRTVLGLSDIYKIIDVRSLNELSGTDMLIISGVKTFTDSDAGNIAEYLKTGRGVLVFPSESADIQGYNRLMQSTGGISVERLVYLSPEQSRSGRFSYFDFQHPMLEGIFKGNNPPSASEQIETPDIKSIYAVLTSENSSVMIQYTGGIPFLTEVRTPESGMLFFSVSAGRGMSDFSRNPLFAPLISRSAAYLSARPFGKTGEPGINHDTLESVLVTDSENEVEKTFEKAGIKNTEFIKDRDKGNLERIISSRRQGTSLWQYFIVIAVLLTLAEMYLSKKLS